MAHSKKHYSFFQVKKKIKTRIHLFKIRKWNVSKTDQHSEQDATLLNFSTRHFKSLLARSCLINSGPSGGETSR